MRPDRRSVLAAATTFAAGLLPAALRGAEPDSQRRAWAPNRATPPLALPGFEGPGWSLAAARGKPVLLNFWASWCEPCRAEMPSLELLATRHERAGLVVLSVNYKEPVATIRRFLEALPFSLPILLDSDGEAAAAWTPRVFPTTVLIDRSGAPQHSVIGELDWMGGTAREMLQPLLARARTA